MFLFTSTFLLACTSLASAARLVLEVSPSQLLPSPASLPPSTHAVLLGPPGVRYDALIRRDNTLVFPEIPDASYLLTIHTRDYFFAPLRVDIKQDAGGETQTISAWQTFRGNEWSNKGPSFGTGKDVLTIQVKPSSGKEYYQARGGFNILNFLKSPMILMALVSVVMIFGMPYLMDNMDPEAKAEFEEMQKKSPLMGSGGAANSLQNFDLAGFLAGKSSTPAAAPSSGSGSKKK